MAFQSSSLPGGLAWLCVDSFLGGLDLLIDGAYSVDFLSSSHSLHVVSFIAL